MKSLSCFRSIIAAATEAEIQADPTLASKLAMSTSGAMVISYAPFEHIQRSARVVVVGITPGAQQAVNALLSARRDILNGLADAEVLARAKVFASFSGPMRANLVAMLDYIGLATWIGVQSTASIWGKDNALVHFTSALRFPTFIDGANYSGAPLMTGVPILRKLLDECLTEEAAALPSAVWVPLGPKAATAVSYLVGKRVLDGGRVLQGLPHPSGANAERIAYFLGRKARELLSKKTDAISLDRARDHLMATVANL